MNRNLVCTFAFAVIVCSAPSTLADDKVPDSEYYPLKVGTTWDCKAAGQTAKVRVARHEKFGDKMCAVVEMEIGGAVVSSEYISVEKNGLYRHSLDGKKLDPPVKFLPLPPKDGDTWKAETKFAGQDLKAEFKTSFDDVKVAAGNYTKALLVTSAVELLGQKSKNKAWYAKGVGMVRAEMEIGGQIVVIEMEKFTPAK
jgi:hypothetical protein